MENYLTTFDLELFVTTSRTTNVNVRVWAPKMTNPRLDTSFTITAGTVKQLKFSYRFRLTGTEMSQKGILVTASDEVVIYGVNKQSYSNDAFLGLPTDVLGKEYYATTYAPAYRYCLILVVGVHDNTKVDITFGDNSGLSVSYGGKKYGRKSKLSLKMDRYSTFQAHSKGDLTGTYIKADKAVSFFSGNKKTNIGRGGSQDHLVEHHVSVDKWGKKFAITPIPERVTGDYYRFVASKSGTSVKVKGQKSGRSFSDSFTLSSPGKWVQKHYDSKLFAYVEANEGILVVQYVLSQYGDKADPAMFIIPPIEQYAADYTFATPKYSLGSYYNYFMFVVKKSEKSGLRMDGNPFPSNTVYNDIPGTDLVGGYVKLTDGTHTCRHTSPISIFGGFLYGRQNYESYGFPTGMRMAPINVPCIKTPTQTGDGIDNDCDGLIDEEMCHDNWKGTVDGKWASWGSWATCSISCIPTSGSRSGTTSRIRTCSNPAPKYDGKQCAGDSSQSKTCTPSSNCPVDGKWGGWGSWGSCSLTCGGGSQGRTRACNNPAPRHGGASCGGSASSSKSCNTHSCPIDGGWGSWGRWATCSLTCGGGRQSRSRSCDSPAPRHGGASCGGSGTSSQSCNSNPCPIDGAWGSWGRWATCSLTCGGGRQSRTRSCDSPAPRHGGASCGGSVTSSQDCNTHNCPIDGKWGSWSSWGTCSLTCGGGSQSRSRTCSNPAPQYGGAQCGGRSSSSQACNTHNCPIDGGWGSWGSWATCSLTCGGGSQSRTRSCSNPAPQYGGAHCVGMSSSAQDCNTHHCPIDGNWGSWGSWATCSVTCGGGSQNRQRSCTNPRPQYGGANCVGSVQSTQACNTHHCPIDGGLSSWSAWGTCTVTCGGGTQDRTRTCTNPRPQYGGAQCIGATSQTQACNTQVCIIDGAWSQWGAWGTCSVTCGTGKQSRARTCTDPEPQNGGLPCSGDSSSMQDCQNAPDNRGTEFIIGYMENYLTDYKLELFVTTSKTTSVSVRVRAPKMTNPSLDESFSITAGSVKQLKFSYKFRLTGTEMSSKGILVTASDEIVIYGVNKQSYSNDAFLGLPTDVLGKEYYATTYTPAYRYCLLLVVGVHDNTKVDITFANNNGISVSYGGKKYSKNSKLSLTMDRYSTFQAHTTGDLTGTNIKADKVVSFFSGNKKTNIGRGGTQDHLVEQQVPVDNWGKKFAITPIPERNTGDYFRFVASESGTNIKVTGQKNGQSFSDSFSLSAPGKWVQKHYDSKLFAYVESNHAVLVVQYVLSQITDKADPAMFIIPPIEQYAADYTFSTPKYSQGSYYNYFMFVVKKSEKSGLRMDGQSFPSNTVYNDIPGTDLVGGFIKITDGTHTCRHTSPISIFGGFLYGRQHAESYGFPTGMRMAPINVPCVPTTTTTGDGLDNDCDGLIDEEMCHDNWIGTDDDGDGTNDEDCAKPPPVHGNWASWSSWATCSVSCIPTSGSRSGTTTRTRTCSNPAPKYDGNQCSGDSSQSKSCTPSSNCPVHGGWGSYGSWSSCSKTCGGGTSTRTRSCNSPTPKYGGNSCSGSASESKSCGTGNCPVDGNWGNWGSWSSCSKVCGGGSQSRSRSCNNPSPAHGGASCGGGATSIKNCNTHSCAVNGNWGNWGSWGSCSLTCGGGTSTRNRACDNPPPQHGGASCSGGASSTKSCNTASCPIDGGWGSWGSWATCSLTCGGGSQSRTRSCSDPAPQYGGASCGGSSRSTQSCNTHNCPIDGNWGNWGSWATCSLTCGGGSQNRQRSCSNPRPQYGGASCAGSVQSTQACNTHHCPIDGGLSSWGAWGTCTVTCGGGTQDRTRSCTNPRPQYGGAPCSGATSQTQACNTQVCIIDGAWSTWGSWGTCSVSCGTGKQSRSRTCSDPRPQNGGLPCSGDMSSMQDCNTHACPTAAAGQYVQLCPTGWFTCQAGGITCIDELFKCDCANDCDDGSDEDVNYAGCSAKMASFCQSGSQSQNAPDNRGKEFIIAYMENYLEDYDLELFVTTSRTTSVSVRVWAPKMTNPRLDTSFSITAGGVKQLTFSYKFRLFGTEMSNKGILITASDEVVIYGVNKQKYSNDAFLGLPTDVLGKEYYATTYAPAYRYCLLLVVGVHDNTKVEITFADNNGISVKYGGKTYGKKSKLTLNMNRYSTFQAHTTGDLTGTYIKADKAVTFFSGNKKTNIGSGGSQDHLVEQQVPVDNWGKKFAIQPIPERVTGDYFRFVATESGTSIKVTGQKSGRSFSDSFTLSGPGKWKQKHYDSKLFAYVESSKAILVVQYVLSQVNDNADPAMFIIPPIEQYAADYTFATPKYSGGDYYNYFMFVVKKSEKSGLRMDGQAFPSNTKYNDIPGTDLVAGFIKIADGTHTARHTSPISIFGGFLYGRQRLESYAFPTGMRMAPINVPCVPTTTQTGDGIDNDCDGLIDEEMCHDNWKGTDDDGDGTNDEDCARPPPVDGNWASWSSWATCSVSCIPTSGSRSGTTTRTRTCSNPAPKYDGKQCSGDSSQSKSCTPSSNCPVHGGWGSYGSWSSCSKTCGGGTSTRTRSCNSPTPKYGGNSCSGSASESKTCGTSSCPVDGKWGSWGSWSSCSKVCGGGSQSRSRSCNNPSPAHGGASCSGSSSSIKNCNTHSCAVNGNWGNWGSWGSCSLTCGGGTSTRNRACDNPPPQHGGASCSGGASSTKSCNTASCPIDGKWSSWGSWNSCSKTCGSGSQSRTRACNNPAPRHGGASCSGSTSSIQNCNTNHCPIDGKWGSWGRWGSCSLTCGGGTQTRSRSCSDPAPKYGGASCSGGASSSQACNTASCPIDGAWGGWGNWASCSLTCGGGRQSRTRACDSPAPRHGGASCGGSVSSTQDCNTHHCPIDGGWGSWGRWATCSLTCGGGRQSRTRSCDSPAPRYGGASCGGSSSSTQNCNTHHCPIDGGWGNWGAWATCSLTCGGGSQSRTRSCSNPAPQYGGASCGGSSRSTQSCNTHNCPIDGNWGNWGSWATCSVTCGGGSQNRQRSCSNPRPQYGGASCVGSVQSTQACNTHHCPIDGGLSSWSAWGTCTVTCGGGTQDRTRTCTNPRPQYGGAPCSGTTSQTQACNTQVCIIDGAWSQWGAWGTCSVTCGTGKQSRSRTCSDPRPLNGGLPCSGDSSSMQDCNTQACPTAAAGQYVQLCPTGWFTCQSGGITCIDELFKCDCASDCDDGSDEDVNYAGCSAKMASFCQSGSQRVAAWSLLLVIAVALVGKLFL
ncbi:hypothetical protein FSP39_022988 [Pinctada imbricata]|uniref:IgGFc-binding protein N-terminal domain-containing protein n=1 Tax=Pinctada imbricata TaxID=66713 RepID=A0AA88XDQ4_PINIB|nr:hypothetical protein FSP39_022988 [Pinctada imbricata]